MKKTIISLSIVAGLFLSVGLTSSNKAIEVKNRTKSNITLDFMNNTPYQSDPGTRPPESI
jgi:hypothetical protein